MNHNKINERVFMGKLDKFPLGKCSLMCPQKEIKRRTRQKLVHILEMVPGTENTKSLHADPLRMIKEFSRSAAGKEMQEECDLRPPYVLLETISYLLDDILLGATSVSWEIRYDFIMDRLRAVRQDMVIQNVCRAECIAILQPIVRFHAYSAYKLCDKDLKVYDPQINKIHLQECLKRLLCMYDELDILYKIKTEENFLDILSEFKPEFEALYLIFNLGEEDALRRALSLPRRWRTDLLIKAIYISLYYKKGNFVRVCSEIKKLPSLLAAVASLHLPKIRRKCLLVMSVAYSSKNTLFPINILQNILLYNSAESLISDCKHYGLEVIDNGIRFIRTSFDQNACNVGPTKEDFVEDKLCDISETTLLLYGK